MPREMGFDYMGMSFQEQKAAQGVPAGGGFRALAPVCLSDPGRPLRKLVPAFQRLAGYADCRRRSVPGAHVRHFENDVYTQIGMVMLIGLAAKNAILIVEFAKNEHERGKSVVQAALDGARLRLRPILMTSFAFILGCVPLWTAHGSGAAGRRILGTVVIGGMAAASLIAIFLIPVTFAVVEGASSWLRRRSKLQPEVAEPKGEQPA